MTFPPKTVLVTGATGLLGIHLVDKLLSSLPCPSRIICLVRAKSQVAAREKLQAYCTAAKMARVGAAISGTPGSSSTVEALMGDLSEMTLGLGDERFRSLACEIDAIYHCGAIVDWSLPFSSLFNANVRGTAEILKLSCSGSRVVPVHHISTIEVAHCAPDGGFCSEIPASPTSPPHSSLPYAHSKWAAELVVEEAKKRGANVIVYRPAVIAGSTETGVVQVDDFWLMMLLACVQLGATPSMPGGLPILSVDSCAASTVAISLSQGASGIFHIVPETNMTYERLFRSLAEANVSGKSIRENVPTEEWVKMLMTVPNALSALSFLFIDSQTGPTKADQGIIPRERTAAIYKECISATTMDVIQFINSANTSGFFSSSSIPQNKFMVSR